MSDNQKEYDNVKKELEVYQNVVRRANNALYVGVTAVLAWAVTTANPTLCLLAYCVIIPVYYIVLDYNIATMKLGAYLLVFHDDKWEIRLHKLNNKKEIKRFALIYKIPFIYASVALTILFFCFFDYKNVDVLGIVQIIVCIVLFLWFNIYVFCKRIMTVYKKEEME